MRPFLSSLLILSLLRSQVALSTDYRLSPGEMPRQPSWNIFQVHQEKGY